MIFDADIDCSAWSGAFERLNQRMLNLEPLLSDIGKVLLPAMRLNIDSGGYPEAFKELADSTKADRARQGYDNKPLVKTGALYRRMTFSVARDWVDVGSSGPQDRRVYYGYDGHPKTPRRNPFVIRPETGARIEHLGVEYLRGGLH